MAWPIALAMMAGTAASALQNSAHGSSMVPSWGDLMRQGEVNDFWSARSEQRALDNSKNLFQYQNVAGPQFSVQGYQRAGINPILAGGYQSTGSFSPSNNNPSVSVGQRSRSDIGQGIINAAAQLQDSKESESRQALNETNAASVAQRIDQEKELFGLKVALQQADLAHKLEMPAYVRKQVDALSSRILSDSMERSVMESNISLNAKKEAAYQSEIDYAKERLSLENRRLSNDIERLSLDKSRHDEDIRYHDKYIEAMKQRAWDGYFSIPGFFHAGFNSAHSLRSTVEAVERATKAQQKILEDYEKSPKGKGKLPWYWGFYNWASHEQ